jgi:hypothetical protein
MREKERRAKNDR